MNISNIAVPMRAQPFHWGHKLLLRRVNELYSYGVVFLHQEVDLTDNPFPFSWRYSWVESFLDQEPLSRVTVAWRSGSPVDKYSEYASHFGGKPFVVLTTPETDSLYRNLGFKTVEHHQRDRDTIWGLQETPQKLDGFGRIIRQRLREGVDCAGYLDKKVYDEALKLISVGS